MSNAGPRPRTRHEFNQGTGFCEICGGHNTHVRSEYCLPPPKRPAVPPVPQEAAPRPDCEMWSSPESVLAFDDELNGEDDTEHGQSSEELGHSFAAHFKPAPPEATAPDEAMRVAEQIWDGDSEAQWQTPEDWIRSAAALIREAGSERERELRREIGQ